MAQNELQATINAAYKAGICIVPPREDGSKRPDVSTWTQYQEVRPSVDDLRTWYANGRQGIGYMCGPVSGNLEAFEFEGREEHGELLELAQRSGLSELVERIRQGYEEETPGGGIHWLYRCDQVAGNTKLARRPKRPAEMEGPDDKVKTLIETRGEGGYIIVAPSSGGVHPTRRPYRLMQGGVGSIADITPEEREALHDLARSFDQMPRQETGDTRRPASDRATAPDGHERAGDAFNRDASWEETGLFEHGWQRVFQRGGVTYIRRPGKSRGVSATLDYQGAGYLYCFSTSTEFDAERGYSKFAVYAILNHGGDFRAAAAELARLARKGYGGGAAGNYSTENAPPPPPPPPAATEPAADIQPSDASEPCTDLGNAERLVRYFGDRIRHSAELGWLFYDGRRWVRDEAPVRELAKRTVRLIYQEASGATRQERREALGKHAVRSEARRAIDAMLALASSDRHITVHPGRLDADPWLFNCLNGTIDLRTGDLLKHDPANLISKLAPVEYDPQAEAPAWERFIGELFEGSEGVADFARRVVGYCLTGQTSEQVWFLLHGAGSNGKSTLLDVLREVFGEYGQQTAADTLLARRNESVPNDLARLQGARFVTAAESGEGRRLDEARIKALTGGDPVSCRFLHREFFEFVPVLKLLFASNHKPRITGTDHAIWRRVRLIPFLHTWYAPHEQSEPKRDNELKAKLRAELPGILAWAVWGCLEWQRTGLAEPRVVLAATEKYRGEMDTVGSFIEDCCEMLDGVAGMSEADVLVQGWYVASSDLYKAYTEWCKREGEEYETQKGLATKLAEKGFINKRTAGARTWWGLKLVRKPGPNDASSGTK
jgi:putative DNA primase/helicase